MQSKDNTIDDSVNQDLIEQEPPEYHIYRALTIYRNDHKDETSNLLFQKKLDEAYSDYIKYFVGD